ncbi:MAG: ribonuclease HII, partial [Oscillospiraceae bacterium]
LYDEIVSKALAYSIVFSSKDEIDEINILNATLLGMKRAVEGLHITPDIAMIDGNKTPEIPNVETVAIIKGDAKSASIAAASILAKVTRDRHMVEMSKKYPQYGFEKHKGYGTKLHRELILEYGPCEEHRVTFLKKVLGRGNA